MRLAILGAALAAMIATVAPASAQVTIRANDDSVTLGERHHHHGWWHHRAECKVIKVRTRLPNGNVIVKTRRSCD